MKRPKIHYLIGDATYPVGEGKKIIPHISNNLGGWGAGFVLAISKRWKEPEAQYRSLKTYTLGDVQLVKVSDDIIVANMIAQNGIINRPSPENKTYNLPPIHYGAVRACLAQVNDYAFKNHCTIHAPRFGSGLAGGNWKEIEYIIKEVMSVDVYIYDLK